MNTGRTRTSSVQSRLAMVNDKMRRKCIDNQLYWISNPVDCVRMRTRKTYEGDDESYIVEMCDVVSAVFPPLEDVPYRKVMVDEKTRAWSLTSLVSTFEEDAKEKFYTLQIPYEFDINVGDMLFRIMLDESQKYPIIIPIQIQEMLGTFGGMMLIMNKFVATIPTDNFPDEIISTIQQMAERRQIIRY